MTKVDEQPKPDLHEDMKIEEVGDDEIPELEDAPQRVDPTEQKTQTTTTRTEKKSKKAMTKLGLEPFNGVTSIQIKQSQVRNSTFLFFRFSLQFNNLKYIKWDTVKLL
jgi:hypothetical protein